MKTFIRMSLMREKEAINEHLSEFTGVILDAHILETFQNASSGYISNNKLRYILDPNTYRLAIDPIIDCTDKRWYDRIIQNFKIQDLINDQGLLDTTLLRDHKRLERFVIDILRYQEDRISNLSGDIESWLFLLEESNEDENQKPYCVIPPYFIIDSEELLDLNIEAINLSLDKSELPIYANIPIYYDNLFNENVINHIIKRYIETDADGFLLWVTDYNEVKERSISLQCYQSLFKEMKELAGSQREVINLFGGFFSTILASKNIYDGLAHGIGISESRNPYGLGGPAPTLYYVPILHRMLTSERADDLILTVKSRCSCPVCSSKMPSELKTMELVRHILNVKMIEQREIEPLSMDEIIAKLDQDYEMIYRSAGDTRTQRTFMAYSQQLKEWVNSLKVL